LRRKSAVPIDFEDETLTGGLAAGGRQLQCKSILLLLSRRDVVLNTLREIASAIAPGSELVVQFIVPAATLSREEGNLVCAAAARAASMGEMTTQERANVVSVASGAFNQDGVCIHSAK
jgi:hypothetical protein